MPCWQKKLKANIRIPFIQPNGVNFSANSSARRFTHEKIKWEFFNLRSGGKWKFLRISSLLSSELSAIRLFEVLRSLSTWQTSIILRDCMYTQTCPDCPIKDLRDEFEMATWHLTFICFFTRIWRVRQGCSRHVPTASNTCSLALVCLLALLLAYRSINI